jgi:hypothetical protein
MTKVLKCNLLEVLENMTLKSVLTIGDGFVEFEQTIDRIQLSILNQKIVKNYKV